MQKPDVDYLSPLDPNTAKQIRPFACSLFKDANGVYLLGSQIFHGNEWKKHKDGMSGVGKVFSFSKCKNLFSAEDLTYSHLVFINQEAAELGEEEIWGFSYYLAKLPEVDPKTFKHIKPTQKRRKYGEDGYYFRDLNNVYYLDDSGKFMFKVDSKNPSSFIAHCIFAEDQNHAYYMGKKISKSEGKYFHKMDISTSDNYIYADSNFKYENDNWTRVKITKL